MVQVLTVVGLHIRTFHVYLLVCTVLHVRVAHHRGPFVWVAAVVMNLLNLRSHSFTRSYLLLEAVGTGWPALCVGSRDVSVTVLDLC